MLHQKLRSKNDQLQILSSELEGKTIINVDEIHNKLKDKEKELNEYNIEKIDYNDENIISFIGVDINKKELEHFFK